MPFLLLNQTFYPDVMASAHYLTEVACGLVSRGHAVTVITGRRAYDDPEKIFSRTEIWRGIRIIRINSTPFGKAARWRRTADFASFLLLCSWRLCLLPRYDAIIALTSPPLISFIGALLAKLRRSRFFYWVMDLNPDEAIAAGWLQPDSFTVRLLESMSRFSLRQAARVIVLDRFMQQRVQPKGVPRDKIVVLPPWPYDSEVYFDPCGRERFRKEYGLENKFVVMYSGNHSPCHPLNTLFEAALKLDNEPEIVFCFIGGGSEWKRIKEHLEAHTGMVRNRKFPRRAFQFPGKIRCLPYQPLGNLSASLSAADLHVVVMGDPFVGIVHPSKIYNILRVGAPLLYIGPRPSHVSEILDNLNGDYLSEAVAHGKVEQVAQRIEFARRRSRPLERQIPHHLLSNFSKESALPKIITVLESE
jgi:colanic acid biosynthesis glycosyl transferase WcaI